MRARAIFNNPGQILENTKRSTKAASMFSQTISATERGWLGREGDACDMKGKVAERSTA